MEEIEAKAAYGGSRELDRASGVLHTEGSSGRYRCRDAHLACFQNKKGFLLFY